MLATRLTTLQKVDLTVVHPTEQLETVRLRETIAEELLEGQAARVTTVRAIGRLPEVAQTVDEAPSGKGDTRQAVSPEALQAAQDDNHRLLVTRVRIALDPVLGEDLRQAAKGVVEGASRDRTTTPIRRSITADATYPP